MTQVQTDHIKALSKVQKELKHAKKSETGAFSKYADLASVYDAIKKPLVDNGFAYFHGMVAGEDGQQYVETILMHESGGVFKTRIPAINRKGDMMGLGSAITYAKRYGISMVIGLASEEDDDAKDASKKDAPIKNTPISNILIYNSSGQFQRSPDVPSAVTSLDIMLSSQMKKYKGAELKQCGVQMRENNKALLETIRNYDDFIDKGHNERFAQLDKKIKAMENAKDE